MRNSACVLAATCLFSTLAVPASAETVNCTAITTLPYTISVQGVYCLTGDLVTGITSGAAITVDTNNVTIDLNGYKVGGQAAGAGTDARGIVASNRSNVRIHNGVVRGFRYGVSLVLGSGHVIENMLLDFNTEKGIDVSSANGAIVRGNRVNNTGGSTFGVDVYGIYVSGGSGVRVLDNDVATTVRNSANTGTAYGIRVMASPAFIDNNRVSDSTDNGIFSSNNSDVTLVNNRVLNSIAGGLIGLRTNTGPSIYKDNIVTGFATPFSASIDGGGNASAP